MSSPRKFSNPEPKQKLKLTQVVAERKSKVTLLGFRTEPRNQVKNIEKENVSLCSSRVLHIFKLEWAKKYLPQSKGIRHLTATCIYMKVHYLMLH